ncbi:unnamed protein product, partial [marine sediment metagenome]
GLNSPLIRGNGHVEERPEKVESATAAPGNANTGDIW